MPYRIDILPAADADLASLPRAQEVTLRRALARFLLHDPSVPSGARKPLVPNPLGVSWELRVGPLRAFYDVDAALGVVRVVRAGYKRGNDLYIRGRKVDLRGQP